VVEDVAAARETIESVLADVNSYAIGSACFGDPDQSASSAITSIVLHCLH
jgi:hypothetical protein